MTDIINTYENRDPEKLKNHPANAEIYGSTPDPDFVASVKEHGVIEPIHVTPDDIVISGHRRKQAAVLNKLKAVKVIVRRDLSDPLDIEEALLVSNQHREKTVEQKAREFERLKSIESRRAELRKKSTQAKPGEQAAARDRVNLPTPKNVEKNEKTGRAADIAAEAVGLSRRTAERAVEVVHEIDEAEQAGDTERAEELRQTLNEKSVSAAHGKVNGKATAEPTDASIVRDGIGRDVPKKLRDQYAAAQAIKTAASKLDAIKREVSKLADEPGGEFLQASEIEEMFKTLKGKISNARYWTHCPRCNGKATCDRCDGNGYLPFRKKGMLSAEDKDVLGVK